MHFTILQLARMVEKSNQSIRETNRYLRYNSLEEQEYQHGAFSGMLGSWTKISRTLYLPLGRNSLFITTKRVQIPLPTQNGLPEDISRLVSGFFTRKEANEVAKTCRAARQTAMESQGFFVANNGKSYTETPYEENPYMAMLF